MPIYIANTMPNINTEAYLNALPLKPSLLDVTQLDQKEDDFAAHWLQQLFQQEQSPFQVYPGFSVGEQLQHIYFSARNYERVKGLSISGLGYPLLLWSQGDEPIAAPLFIWQMSIAPAQTAIGSWVIASREERVIPNPVLIDFLATHYGVDIAPTLTKAIQNSRITPQALVSCCNEIAEKLGVENSNQSIAIEPCPNGDALEKLITQGTIQWSGVAGIFQPYFSETAKTATTTLSKGPKDGHDFGLLPLDAHQASAFQAISNHPAVLVKGASGTGKTHLLLHLLTNALSNSKRCLVVSENMGALRQVYNQLEQLGLLKYSFLLQDGGTDKSVLINLLRTIANAEAAQPAFDEPAYRIALDKSNRLKTKLDEQYQHLRRKVFGPHNWTETVGLFLRSNRVEGKELLASHLNTQDFNFTYDEFQALQEGIRISQPLYQKINTLRHPLSNLYEGVFTKQTQTDGLHFVTSQTQAFLSKAEKLHHRYITKTNAYADWLAERYEGEYGDFANALVRVKERIADFVTKFGTDFEQTGTGALRLRGAFSSKYRAVLEARDEVAEQYNLLVRKMEQRPLFDFKFAPAAEGKNMQKVRQNLIDFEKALQEWRESHPGLVQDEVQRLNAKGAETEWKEAITELEYGLDELVQELNTAHLYQQSFENKMLTIPKRQKYLEEIIEQLENTQLYSREYDVFYDWQRHWLGLPENAKKIIRALVKVKPNDWMQAFGSWYLHNCLNAYGTPLTVEEKSIMDYVRIHSQLIKLLPAQIAQYWYKKRAEVLKNLRRSDRAAFQLIFDKKTIEIPKDKVLPQVLEPIVDAVSTIFPVLLATPYAVMTALPQLSQHFDYVLFDEAQFLSEADIQRILPLAKQVVFFEDASLLKSSQASAALNWAVENQASICTLQTCHRWNPGNVLQSLNGNDLADSAVGNFSIHFKQVGGRYEEQLGTNDEEAQHIIHLLNEIKPTSQRTFPAVGIVCLTVAQRDLIASYLLKIKQKWSPGADKIQQLERNGLGVFHVNELDGQHFDVLIISTVYGIKNTKGELTAQVAHLNENETVTQLQTLMSRPLQALFIVNSIPKADLENWTKTPEHIGYFLFGNYLIYNAFLQAGNASGQQEVISRLKNWLYPDAAQSADTVFVEEMAIALQPYFGEQRIKTNVQHAQLNIPLLIESANAQQKSVALIPDGFFANTSATDYVWEDEQRDVLTQQGFIYQPIWSVQWWKNPRQEARKLAGVIIKMDKEQG